MGIPTESVRASGTSTFSTLALSGPFPRFASKKRNVTELYVQPEEPYRRYYPGDLVKGAVVLEVVRPVRITHLVACLHGSVRVSRNAKIRNKIISPGGGYLGTGTRKRETEYFGNGCASLFENEVCLFGEGRLEVGKYICGFELELPSEGLPTSIDVRSKLYLRCQG